MPITIHCDITSLVASFTALKFTNAINSYYLEVNSDYGSSKPIRSAQSTNVVAAAISRTINIMARS